MSGMHAGGCPLIVVQHRNGGTDVEAYKSKLEMVKAVANNGGLGDGAWGSPSHLNAVLELRDYIELILPKLRKEARKYG